MMTGSHVVIEAIFVPTMAKMIGAILRFAFGVDTVVVGDSIFLLSRGLPYELYLSWDCIGWQSLVFLAFSMATWLQGKHSLRSKVKCVLLGLELFIALNLLRIVATALILLRWGYGPTIFFHDQISVILTFTCLALYGIISGYILEPAVKGKPLIKSLSKSIKSVRIRSLLPDFIYGRRTMGLATMFIVLMTTALSGVNLLSVKASGETDMTQLSFEYTDPPVVVNTVSTNRILTVPPSDLGTTHTDDYTTSSDKFELAWSFYLYGPLDDDYEMEGDLAFVVYMYASEECEVKVKFKIFAVKEDGHTSQKFSKDFNVELGTSSPSTPSTFEEHIKKKKYKEGETLLVEIWLESEEKEEITYYFQYDSTGKHSYIDLPGVVVPERLTPFLVPMIFVNTAIFIHRRKKY